MTSQPYPPPPTHKCLGTGDPAYEAWRDEVDYFLSIRTKLWEDTQLRSKYISLYKHQIIDSGTDRFELGRRAAREHPGEVVLVVKVELELPRRELPSFEVRRCD
ncbi:MAG TPA: hypothetical protein VHM90_14880 [Phycisphaerae bacterium]|jgi:hypothetical protein|nr:hypothetical protein [Phycisphaerae bacterium]